jgi:hypothetical protein
MPPYLPLALTATAETSLPLSRYPMDEVSTVTIVSYSIQRHPHVQMTDDRSETRTECLKARKENQGTETKKRIVLYLRGEHENLTLLAKNAFVFPISTKILHGP